jgi:hypothetical protein
MLKYLKKLQIIGLFILATVVIAIGSVPPSAQAMVTVPTPGIETQLPVELTPQITKIQCAKYAMMIKNIITSINNTLNEKIKYYEDKIQILYDQATTAFLAGDMTLYYSIMSQIDSLQNMLNQYITVTNQVLSVLNQALMEAQKKPCNIGLIKELITKALNLHKEAMMLCDKLIKALDALKQG